MKRALVLALMLVLVVSAGVFAQQRGELEVLVKVLPYAEVEVPTQLELTVLGKGDTVDEDLDVNIKSNSAVKVTVSSRGFYERNIGPTITYKVGYGDYAYEFKPGSDSWDITFNAIGNKPYTVNFALDYSPGDNWHTVPAGTYSDIITWTVEAIGN